MKSSAPAPSPFVAVTRKPRRQWTIPLITPISQTALRADKLDDDARRRALLRSTTALGRDILRKILFRAETLFHDPARSMADVVSALEDDFKSFDQLRPEFATMLGWIWGGGEQVFGRASPRSLATLVVVRARAAQGLGAGDSESAAPSTGWKMLL